MEKKNIIVSETSKQTEKTGADFVKRLKKGDVIVLSGRLGSGKTTFVKGLARGLNIKSRIISPTFVLVRSHKGSLNGQDVRLHHIDIYRLGDDLKTFGIEDVFEDESGIYVVEWGEKQSKIKANWNIEFDLLAPDRRRILIYEK